MNIKEYEEREVKKKEFEGAIENALSTFLDRKELCCERGYESDSVRCSIIISHTIKAIKLEMGTERMSDNGAQTIRIYHKHIEPALNLLEDAARELLVIGENQKW